MSVVRGQMVLRGLRFRVNGCRTQKVVQNLGLHSFNFQAVTASSSLEFPRAGGLAHLGKPALEAHDTFLCCFEFLVVSYHIVTSTMPRLSPPRLICQYRMNSSTVSSINMPGRIQKTLAP